jgi:hypothetical protein
MDRRAWILITVLLLVLLVSFWYIGRSSRQPSRYEFRILGEGPPIICRMDTASGEIQLLTPHQIDGRWRAVGIGSIPGWDEISSLDPMRPVALSDLGRYKWIPAPAPAVPAATPAPAK